MDVAPSSGVAPAQLHASPANGQPVVRELTSVADCAQVAPLTRAVWGPGAPDYTVDLLRALVHTGGYLSGAYLPTPAGGESLVGFCMGLLAEHEGRSVHSHATGVLAAARGRHVGLALKEHQREWAAARGIATITWTYDPLVRRNATFNLLRLRARPAQYLEDFYGRIGDDLNGDDPTDRLFVVWPVRATEPVVPQGLLEGAARLLGDVDGAPVQHGSDAPVVLVGTPPDIEGLRRSDPGLAGRWRQVQREVLATAMRGGRVVAFTRGGDYVVDRRQKP